MFRFLKNSSLTMLCAGAAAGLLVGAGMLVGAMVAMNSGTHTRLSDPVAYPLPQREVRAASASTGKQIAVTTGPVFDDAEGLFVLDYLTGDLFCYVLFGRNLGAGYIGRFKTNVLQDLGTQKGKQPDYVLCTGNISPLRGSATAQPASCICYVADGSSGKVAAYALKYNPTMAKTGRPQEGMLVKIAVINARPTGLQREQ